MGFYGNTPKARIILPDFFSCTFSIIDVFCQSDHLCILYWILCKSSQVHYLPSNLFIILLRFFIQVDVIHRRLHKDILHNPVVMLNFCPNLKSICSDLRKVHGEFIFLIDRSGSMSGLNIHRVKVLLPQLDMSSCFISSCYLHTNSSCVSDSDLSRLILYNYVINT